MLWNDFSPIIDHHHRRYLEFLVKHAANVGNLTAHFLELGLEQLAAILALRQMSDKKSDVQMCERINQASIF